MAISLLNQREYKVTDKVTVRIPTLGEYRGYVGENQFDLKKRADYESLMNLFLSTPSNYMLQLHKIGRDFRQISEYEFFIELFYAEFIYAKTITSETIDSRILFNNIDFRELHIITDDNGKTVIVNDNGEIVIDEYVYIQVGLLFCEILNTKKYRRKPANQAAYDYFIELEEEHQRNRKRIKRKEQNQFDELIIAMVCDGNFPYDFNTINSLTVYDFNCCVRQIIKRVNYNNIMRGAYSGFGTIDLKKIDKAELNYLSFR